MTISTIWIQLSGYRKRVKFLNDPGARVEILFVLSKNLSLRSGKLDGCRIIIISWHRLLETKNPSGFLIFWNVWIIIPFRNVSTAMFTDHISFALHDPMIKTRLVVVYCGSNDWETLALHLCDPNLMTCDQGTSVVRKSTRLTKDCPFNHD